MTTHPLLVEALLAAADRHGYWHPFKVDPKPHDLMLGAVRSAADVVGEWDDALFALAVDEHGAAQLHLSVGTTDPGREGAGSGLHRNGVACMVPGQHRGLWEIGVHARGRKSEHRAFVQRAGVKVPTWRDRVVDGRPARDGAVYYDAAGINRHRASSWRRSELVGDWSHGCIVHRDALGLDIELALAEAHIAAGLGRRFSCTLFDAGDDPELDVIVRAALAA